MKYRARIEGPLTRMAVRLKIAGILSDGYEVLLEDANWRKIPEGMSEPEDSGIVLPPESLEAIAVAIAEHLGNALPSQAEVSVLRETLAKEQSRVDAVLERGRW